MENNSSDIKLVMFDFLNFCKRYSDQRCLKIGNPNYISYLATI